MKHFLNHTVRALCLFALTALSVRPALAQIQHEGQPLHWNQDVQLLSAFGVDC